MRGLSRFLMALVFCIASIATTAFAGDSDPLFINLTSDDPHRANMAISFGGNQHGLGHPLTIFLNDKGALIGSREHSARFAVQQKTLAEIMSKGATVIICPMCMKHYGIKESDVLPNIKVGNPEITGAALFKDSTRTLSW